MIIDKILKNLSFDQPAHNIVQTLFWLFTDFAEGKIYINTAEN
jgi:hypothetical protein